MSDRSTEARESGEGLERLLEVEARIDARLAECRAEAEKQVRAVREELAERDARLSEELRAERERRLAAREELAAAAIRAERARAAREARRLRAIPADRVEDFARDVVGRLLDGAEEQDAAGEDEPPEPPR